MRRIAQLILRINERYNLCITQAYAPTSNSTIEEAANFYEALSDSTAGPKSLYQIAMGDFNAKVGAKI